MTWTGTARSPVMIVIAVLAVGFAVVLAFVASFFVFVCLLVALAMVPFLTIAVEVAPAGVTIRYGPLPWPVTRFVPAEIASVSVVEIRPMSWGGWGYRGSRKLFRKAAIVLRRGEGIRFELNDGTELRVTVDDAAAGAARLSPLLPRAHVRR